MNNKRIEGGNMQCKCCKPAKELELKWICPSTREYLDDTVPVCEACGIGNREKICMDCAEQLVPVQNFSLVDTEDLTAELSRRGWKPSLRECLSKEQMSNASWGLKQLIPKVISVQWLRELKELLDLFESASRG